MHLGETYLGHQMFLSPISTKLLSQLGKVISGSSSYAEHLHSSHFKSLLLQQKALWPIRERSDSRKRKSGLE